MTKRVDIMAALAANPVSFVTVPNVEIAQTGIEYPLMSGPWTPTTEDLLHAVQSQDDPAIHSPRLGLGHIDPRFNNPEFDGQPAFGVATNLRLANNDQTLVGDFVVPEWLGQLMPVAWPSRSLEAARGAETVTGHTWNVVITRIKLLGIMLPGITTIEDIPLMYGSETPVGIELSDEIRAVQSMIAASEGGTMGGLRLRRKPDIEATVNVEDVRREFYGSLEAAQMWWWIRAVQLDPNELIVDDDDGKLYRVPFTITGDEISFEDPVEVKIKYDDVKVAASAIVAGMTAGHEVAVVYASRADSRPETPEGGSMDGVQLRSTLGLAESATDAEVSARVQEIDTAGGGGLLPQEARDHLEQHPVSGATPAEPSTPTGPTPPDPAPAPAPAPTPDPAPAPSAMAEQLAASGLAVVDKETLEGMKKLIASNAVNDRDATIRAAVSVGKIPPARKGYWEAYWARDAEGAKQALAALEPGLVPVGERGVNDEMDVDPGGGPAEPLPWFAGEIEARQKAAGQPVAKDQNYRGLEAVR